MEALIMAGGKGSRMGKSGIEKPMTMIGGKCTVMRVVEAMQASKYVDKVLVSVSSNTPATEEYLNEWGVETIRTSGGDFVDDLHVAFNSMKGDDVIYSPSDLPLLRSYTIDAFIDFFYSVPNDSAMALVEKDVVIKNGITPSFSFDLDGEDWVISGLTIMDRIKTLENKILEASYFKTDWVDLAINVNTDHELKMAKEFFKSNV